MNNAASREGLFSRSCGPGGQCNSHGSSRETSWGRCCFSRGKDWPGHRAACPGSHGQSAAGLGSDGGPRAAGPRSVRYVRGGAGGWDVAPRRVQRFLHVRALSRPRLGLSLCIRNGDRGPRAAPSAPSVQGSQGSLSSCISTQSLGERLPPPELGGQRWAWGAPLLLDHAVNKSTPWLPATLHGPLSDAGSAMVVNRHSHERLIKAFSF